MDEATGQPSTAEANQSRKRRRKEGETTSEVESAIVTEETPAKKVLECHVYPPNTSIRVKYVFCLVMLFPGHVHIPFLFQPKKWKNKQRVLVFCARGITYRLVVLHYIMSWVCFSVVLKPVQ